MNAPKNTPPAGATYVAIDPATGLHLRAATSDETAEYTSRNVFPFDVPTGPGIWFGGAGF